VRLRCTDSELDAEGKGCKALGMGVPCGCGSSKEGKKGFGSL
jgi:hypothetical protein